MTEYDLTPTWPPYGRMPLVYATTEALEYFYRTSANDNMPHYVCIVDGHIIETIETERHLNEITVRQEIRKIEQLKLVNLPGAKLREIK